MKYSSHAQYINDKKVEVPSVTTILKILNKPSLNKWANYLGFKREKIDDVLKFSADKGTEVHYMLHAFLFQMKYIFIESDNGVTKDYLVKVLDNFIDWSSNHTIKPIFGEKSITCDLFGGTVDLYCELDGVPTILDLMGVKYYNNFYFGHSVFDDKESVLYSRAYNIFLRDNLYLYSMNNILYKGSNITNEEIAEFEEEAKKLLTKLSHIDRIFYNDFFARSGELDTYLNNVKNLNQK